MNKLRNSNRTVSPGEDPRARRVKCKDEIESGRQRWSHIEVHEIARRLGMANQDLFVLTQKHDPMIQSPNQQHARKNHSYLWIFKKRT